MIFIPTLTLSGCDLLLTPLASAAVTLPGEHLLNDEESDHLRES